MAIDSQGRQGGEFDAKGSKRATFMTEESIEVGEEGSASPLLSSDPFLLLDCAEGAIAPCQGFLDGCVAEIIRLDRSHFLPGLHHASGFAVNRVPGFRWNFPVLER